MNVNMDDWQLELQTLLDMFERESTLSLRKINRFLAALGRPFDERFRQYFLRKSTTRLDMSFDAILFERYDENPAQVTPNANAPADNKEIASNTNLSGLAVDNVVSLERNRNIEKNIDVAIEIIDSDDEDNNEHGHFENQPTDGMSANQMKSNTLEQFSSGNGDHDAGHIDIELSNENGTGVDMKHEIKVEIKTETEIEDLPVVEFDPVKANCCSSNIENDHASVPGLSDHQSQSSTSLKKQSKRSDAKCFKCKDCAYTSQHKWCVIRHQRIHIQQKIMGFQQDHNGEFFKCMHCDQQFVNWRVFKIHLAKAHKNKQRLFNCVRCMRQFTKKTEKDSHEMQCQRRHYECYLCKKYVTTRITNMQEHMRTHTGAKPFQCAVCNKRFRQKHVLKNHLNSKHSRAPT